MSALREPDRFVQETAAAARTSCGRCVDDVKEYTRKEPEKAMLSAIAAGYVLRGLPLLRIGGTVVRLLAALVKPVGMVYGGAVMWQKLRNATSGESRRLPEADSGDGPERAPKSPRKTSGQ